MNAHSDKGQLDKSREILHRVKSGKASDEEINQVYHWWLKHAENNEPLTDAEIENDIDEIWKALSIHKKQRNRSIFLKIAAGLILVGAFSFYWFMSRNTPEQTSGPLVAEIFAGENRTILRLGDGRVLRLAAGQEGIIVSNGITYLDGASVSQEGLLIPDNLSDNENFELVTPKGGIFKVVLPDGTEVWLNAESRLSYPQKFPSTERRVHLEGEAYFEVSENKHKPFLIETATQTVRVLGTAFNLSAYREEPTVTTLVEGSVAVTSSGNLAANPAPSSTQAYSLEPNQQLTYDRHQFVVRNVDTDAFTAWKDGFFRFKDEDIHSIMRKLERWYDVKVAYEGKPPSDHFNGKIARSKSLKHVLRMLENTRSIKFKIEIDDTSGERRVMIM